MVRFNQNHLQKTKIRFLLACFLVCMPTKLGNHQVQVKHTKKKHYIFIIPFHLTRKDLFSGLPLLSSLKKYPICVVKGEITVMQQTNNQQHKTNRCCRGRCRGCERRSCAAAWTASVSCVCLFFWGGCVIRCAKLTQNHTQEKKGKRTIKCVFLKKKKRIGFFLCLYFYNHVRKCRFSIKKY